MPTGKYKRILKKFNCKICAKEFYGYSTNNKYCSRECSLKRWSYKNIVGVVKKCDYCGLDFNAKQKNIKFCSISCSSKHSFGKRKKYMNKLYEKRCLVCGVKSFMYQNQKYCSSMCKNKVSYKNNDTEKQYKSISGNWRRYLISILQHHKRKADGLTIDDLLKVLKRQNYKCALSGETMTCLRKKGIIYPNNASIDRINAGGKYSVENIRLVCRAVNSWRSNLSTEQFIEWCKKIVKYNI